MEKKTINEVVIPFGPINEQGLIDLGGGDFITAKAARDAVAEFVARQGALPIIRRSDFDRINAQLNGKRIKDSPSKYEAIIDSYPLKVVDGREYPVVPIAYSRHIFVREQGIYWLDKPVRFLENNEDTPFFTPVEESLVGDFVYLIGLRTVHREDIAIYFELRRDDIHGWYELIAISRPEKESGKYIRHDKKLVIELFEGNTINKETLFEHLITRFVDDTFREYHRLSPASDRTVSSPDQTS